MVEMYVVAAYTRIGRQRIRVGLYVSADSE